MLSSAPGTADFLLSPGAGPLALAPSAKIPVEDLSRKVLVASVDRLFRPSEEASAASLAVRIEQADVDLSGEGWYAYIDYEYVLRDPAGADLGRWRVRGEGPIRGHGVRAVPRAFAEAAERAAAVFERELERPAPVAAWIRSAGLEPRALPPGPAYEPPPPAPAPGPRSARLVFAELTGGVLGVAHGGWSSSVGTRAGWSGKWLVAQVAADSWPLEFVAAPPAAWGSGRVKMIAVAAGGDVALRLPVGPSLEVQGGLGARMVWGRGTAEYTPLSAPTSAESVTESAVGLGGTVFAAARWIGALPRLGVRFRVGLEVRRALGATLDLPTLGATHLGVADFGASLLVGIELPVGRRVRPL